MDENNMDIIEPKASEMKMPEEFVYAARIVKALSKLNLEKPCERDEAITAIERTFYEYKDKILKK